MQILIRKLVSNIEFSSAPKSNFSLISCISSVMITEPTPVVLGNKLYLPIIVSVQISLCVHYLRQPFGCLRNTSILTPFKMSSFLSVCSPAGLALIFALSTNFVVSQNFKANFGSSPAPFVIDVDPKFIEKTVLKASLTRYVADIEIPDLLDGPPRHNVTTVRDYWVNQYNWFDVQDQLNQQYPSLIWLRALLHTLGSLSLGD